MNYGRMMAAKYSQQMAWVQIILSKRVSPSGLYPAGACCFSLLF
jgi:hypothetical protein